MANEISVLSDSGRSVELLLLFPVDTPKTVNGANVIDRNPAEIPQVGGRDIITNAERNAILGGTASFKIVTFTIDPEATNPELLAQVQALYATEAAAFDAGYEARWRFAGNRHNAT